MIFRSGRPSPRKLPYLLIHTENEQYLFGTREPERTEAIYRELCLEK